MTRKSSAPGGRFADPRGAGRRRFLGTALGALAAMPAGAAFGAGFGAGSEGETGALAGIRRRGGHYLVDGWVLTGEDLRALGIALPAAASLGGAARIHDL
ncbi:hypothetical protein [Amaricoccus solimangrovi]|uniref:Uncharacterized protein n=1 Tax=Amaricoccus solimangrovi TaxID=2589815 RepID=A0A501WEY1_9RHOB|nr:hypothetical protein [Amaricoccus solimangrovi]TPE48403.1 hypothetical protein FJM51_17715 [Amaricoccus solimangrovi]